jgi:thymidylate synthase (FAD)
VELITEWYKKNHQIAPEMSRMILPQAMLTSWYWTGNLLAFAHVYKERIAEGAQLEAQHFAKELDKIIRPLFPESWQALVGGD